MHRSYSLAIGYEMNPTKNTNTAGFVCLCGFFFKIVCKTDWHKHDNIGYMQQKCIISQYEDDTSIKINDTPLSY